MARSHILVDTNTYLRLAKSIKPLLGVPFGQEAFCLTIIPELNDELAGKRLQSKFHWIDDDEYLAERTYFPQLSKKQKKEVDRGFDVIWDYVTTEFPGPSRVDVRYVAYAAELECVLVTDDQDMGELAATFGLQVIPTLQLLKMLVDCGHVPLETAKGLLDYWRYLDDVPANFARDCRKFFGT